ncbi:hypothetical protein F5Y05DRAFT_414796 [Hypoxylon sp. FL0543]|nr:hypothetical protein F5Y05DRAFT_414796 [Hypoxylon sp. FL0543]
MMELLIDISSPEKPSYGSRPANDAKPSIDLLDDRSSDIDALLGCPVLVAGLDGRPAAPVSPVSPVSLGALGPSVASTVLRRTNNIPKAMQHDVTYVIPKVKLARAQEVAQPGPLRLPSEDPFAAIRDALSTGYTSSQASQRAQANLIISYTLEVASGVVEAVHKELSQVEGPYKLELRKINKWSYLRITASEKNIPKLVCAVQDTTNDLISDEAVRVSGIFQEPPARLKSSSQVVLIIAQSGHARPILQLGPGTDNDPERPESFQKYTAKLNDHVHRGLKKAGRLPLALNLRVQLGSCMLRTYPQGREVYKYSDFHAMVKNPRAAAWLKTSIGNEIVAIRLLDFIRDDVESPFKPTTNQIFSSTHVLPDYAFEANSQVASFNAPIVDKSHRGRGQGAYELSNVTVSAAADKFADLDIINLSVGKNLDWQLQAFDQERSAKAFPNVVRYLSTAKVHFECPDRPHDLDVYPRVILATDNLVAGYLKDVAVKTIYRYKWKSSSYIVQVAVNRRWETISAMCSGQVPTVNLSVSFFGEDWDSEGDAAGIVWGSELENLLEEGDASMDPKGIDRVAHFLQTVRDVRNVLDPFFQNGGLC